MTYLINIKCTNKGINSLAPGKIGSIFKMLFSNSSYRFLSWVLFCEIALRGMLRDNIGG